MRTLIAAALALLAGGCVTVQTVPSTKPWEGRYESKAEAEAAVGRMELGRGESVWILSNRTMKRLLKTTKE